MPDSSKKPDSVLYDIYSSAVKVEPSSAVTSTEGAVIPSAVVFDTVVPPGLVNTRVNSVFEDKS